MVRKLDRTKADLRSEATCSFTNAGGVECFLLNKGDEYFALNFELNMWVSIPKWAYLHYSKIK